MKRNTKAGIPNKNRTVEDESYRKTNQKKTKINSVNTAKYFLKFIGVTLDIIAVIMDRPHSVSLPAGVHRHRFVEWLYTMPAEILISLSLLKE